MRVAVHGGLWSKTSPQRVKLNVAQGRLFSILACLTQRIAVINNNSHIPLQEVFIVTGSRPKWVALKWQFPVNASFCPCWSSVDIHRASCVRAETNQATRWGNVNFIIKGSIWKKSCRFFLWILTDADKQSSDTGNRGASASDSSREITIGSKKRFEQWRTSKRTWNDVHWHSVIWLLASQITSVYNVTSTSFF